MAEGFKLTGNPVQMLRRLVWPTLADGVGSHPLLGASDNASVVGAALLKIPDKGLKGVDRPFALF